MTRRKGQMHCQRKKYQTPLKTTTKEPLPKCEQVRDNNGKRIRGASRLSLESRVARRNTLIKKKNMVKG